MRAIYPQPSRAQVTAALRYATAYPRDVADPIALADAAEAEAMESVPAFKVS